MTDEQLRKEVETIVAPLKAFEHKPATPIMKMALRAEERRVEDALFALFEMVNIEATVVIRHIADGGHFKVQININAVSEEST